MAGRGKEGREGQEGEIMLSEGRTTTESAKYQK